jgi:hypothetical protein
MTEIKDEYPIINFDFNEDEFLNKHILAPLVTFNLLIYWMWKNKFTVESNVNYLYYNKIYIYVKDLTVSKYQILHDFFEEVETIMKEKCDEDFKVNILSINNK